jgi:hypothetical protein
MKCTLVTKYAITFLCLLSGLMSATLVAAQVVSSSQSEHSTRFFHYNPANEVAVSGIVQQVVTKRNIGTPPGIHLLVSGPQGMVDAHVGAFLAKDVQAALRTGSSVKVVGALEQLHGQHYLLARQLIFNGRVMNVRTSKGFLVRPLSAHTSRAAARESASNGGR